MGGALGALPIEPLAGGAQPALLAAGRGDRLGQFVAPAVAPRLGFGDVGGDLLLDDRAGRLLVVRSRLALAATFVPSIAITPTVARPASAHRPRDRRVIGALLRSDHPAGHVLQAGALDPSRRPHPTRSAVQQQRDHHGPEAATP